MHGKDNKTSGWRGKKTKWQRMDANSKKKRRQNSSAKGIVWQSAINVLKPTSENAYVLLHLYTLKLGPCVASSTCSEGQDCRGSQVRASPKSQSELATGSVPDLQPCSLSASSSPLPHTRSSHHLHFPHHTRSSHRKQTLNPILLPQRSPRTWTRHTPNWHTCPSSACPSFHPFASPHRRFHRHCSSAPIDRSQTPWLAAPRPTGTPAWPSSLPVGAPRRIAPTRRVAAEAE